MFSLFLFVYIDKHVYFIMVLVFRSKENLNKLFTDLFGEIFRFVISRYTSHVKLYSVSILLMFILNEMVFVMPFIVRSHIIV